MSRRERSFLRSLSLLSIRRLTDPLIALRISESTPAWLIVRLIRGQSNACESSRFSVDYGYPIVEQPIA